jgi:hypothetical protein
LNVNRNDVKNLLKYIQELTQLQLKGQLFALGRDLADQVKENADQIKWHNSIFAIYVSFDIFQRNQHSFNKRIRILHKGLYLRQFYRRSAVYNQIPKQLVDFVVILQRQYPL